MSKTVNNPCQDCQARTATCHCVGHCKRYDAYVQKQKKARKTKREGNAAEMLRIDFFMRARKAWKKK